MNQTDDQDLPYPDCSDPADGALDLQVLAEAVNAKLVPQFAAFRTAINKPGFVYGLSADQGGFTAGANSAVNFDRTVYRSGVVSDPGSGARFYQTGYWMIGAYLVTSPSGASTIPALVRCDLYYVDDLLVPLGGVATEQWSSQGRISGNGFTYSTVVALVRQEFDGSTSFAGSGDAIVKVFHENVASDLIVRAQSLVWGFKVSELETS